MNVSGMFRTTRLVAAGAASALVGVLLTPASAGAADDPGAVLDKQTVSLRPSTNRAPGMPTTTDPGRQLASASVTVQHYPQDSRDSLVATVRLAGLPQPAPTQYDDDAALEIGYGHFSGTNCRISAVSRDETSRHSGTTYTEYDWVGTDSATGVLGPRPTRPFDCVAVILRSLSDPEVYYDAMVGRFANHHRSPRLRFGALTLLGTKQGKVKLVKGLWTRYSVTVRNTGDGPVRSVSLTGRGKGLKVRGDKFTSGVGPGQSATLDLRVRLTGRARTSRLRLTADAGRGVRASRTVRVKRVAPPRQPRSGAYRSPQGHVRFTVRNRKVVGFRITTTTRCGTYLNPTTTTNTYDFPARRIPRNGIFDATQSGRASGGGKWSAALSFRMVGGTVTHARFRYYFYQPGMIGSNCSAAEGFKVRRGR